MNHSTIQRCMNWEINKRADCLLIHSRLRHFTLLCTCFFFFFVSMALSPSSSLRFFPMVTTIWSAASTLQRRSWLRFTRPCLTTTSTWRVLCSSPTWSLPDTPAPTNTATRRSLWPPLPPCAAPCLLQSLVRWLHAVMQTLQTQSCV